MSYSQAGAAIGHGRLEWVTRRWLNLFGFLVCLGGLGVALFAQFHLGMEPCPLCIFQRLALAALGVLFLVAALHDPRDWGAKIYGVLLDLTALLGMGIAARQVWLQHLPSDEVPQCGPGLDYMLQNFPLSETIRMALTGSGECAKVETLLGLSIPEWTLMLFLGLGVMGLLGNWRLRR